MSIRIESHRLQCSQVSHKLCMQETIMKERRREKERRPQNIFISVVCIWCVWTSIIPLLLIVNLFLKVSVLKSKVDNYFNSETAYQGKEAFFCVKCFLGKQTDTFISILHLELFFLVRCTIFWRRQVFQVPQGTNTSHNHQDVTPAVPLHTDLDTTITITDREDHLHKPSLWCGVILCTF